MQSVARLVISLSIICVFVACDETPDGVNAAGDGAAGAPSTTAAVSLSEISERLETHLDGGDLCPIFETINELKPSYDDAEDLRASLTLVWSALDDALDMVPDDLADDWDRLVSGTSEAISTLSGPDASVEDLRPVYSSTELMAAERRIDEWMAEHCDD